jgi:hypothetical protein
MVRGTGTADDAVADRILPYGHISLAYADRRFKGERCDERFIFSFCWNYENVGSATTPWAGTRAGMQARRGAKSRSSSGVGRISSVSKLTIS